METWQILKLTKEVRSLAGGDDVGEGKATNEPGR